jgi:hypothetical protein
MKPGCCCLPPASVAEAATTALIDRAIGATRALVLAGDTVLEAHLERDDGGPLPGTITGGRVAELLVPAQRAIIDLDGGGQGLLEPAPGVRAGSRVQVAVVRAAIPEAGRPRLPKLRLSEAASAAGPDLATRLAAAGHRIVTLPQHGLDQLEAAGWGESVAEATSGFVAFPGGMLTITPTPAMLVVDVDGPGPGAALAQAAVPALAAAIGRHGLAGSIVVDFPNQPDRAARLAIDVALAAALPPPFEKTVMNGFGLVQIIRPRVRASLPEQVRAPGFAALELLRRAGRCIGAARITAHPQIIDWLSARPALLAALARQTGGVPHLASDPLLAISGGHVG